MFQSTLLQTVTSLRASAARRFRAVRDDERGQTPTEYLMIVGLMAAVIVFVFITTYWPEVKEAATQWTDKVKTTVLGTDIQ